VACYRVIKLNGDSSLDNSEARPRSKRLGSAMK